MVKRLLAASAVALVLAASVTVIAAPQALLILRSGDQVRGQLIDLSGAGYTIRTGGVDQDIPANDVAVISFMGSNFPANEVARMQEGRPFIVLRSGDIVAGRLIDIGGNDPLRLSVRTPDGNQDFDSYDVARIYLARWEGMPSGSASSSGQAELESGGAGIPVPARQCWTDTGIYVNRGQTVSFNGSGEIQLSENRNDTAVVTGSKLGRQSDSAPLPEVPVGALIGRVGSSRPFGIGDQRQPLGMPAAGELWLGVNDDHCPDNRGEFRVEVRVGRR
ncbi:MAG: hypothetical protein NTY02_02625 [Acidobacteria bacterium]|nr:hypothetical protein [Acidobacteriota bacterium]